MTQYESAILLLPERLNGADLSLTTSIAEIHAGDGRDRIVRLREARVRLLRRRGRGAGFRAEDDRCDLRGYCQGVGR